MQHHEASLAGQLGFNASLSRSLTNEVVQFDQRLPDKGHPAVLGGQFFQNVGVKHKDTVHFVAIFQGVKQGGIVCHPQIASKPDQAGRKGFVHGLEAVKIETCLPILPPLCFRIIF